MMTNTDGYYYYIISTYLPYEDSDDFIIMKHKGRFTDSALSAMVYDVIRDYMHEYAETETYNRGNKPCDLHVNGDGHFRMIHGLKTKYGFEKCYISANASIEEGYILRADETQSPLLHKMYEDLEIGQCEECFMKDTISFQRDGCPVKNKRRSY